MDRLRCAHCGEIVGVYEPARLLLRDGSARRGSALTLRDEPEVPGSNVVHEYCHEPFELARGQVDPWRES